MLLKELLQNCSNFHLGLHPHHIVANALPGEKFEKIVHLPDLALIVLLIDFFTNQKKKVSPGSKAKGLVGASDEVALLLHGKSVRVKFIRVRPILRVKMKASLDHMKN